VFVWCSPSLLGFVLFLFSFPIDRQISIWPHWPIAAIFFLWFIFVTPITTVVAFVVFVKRKRRDHLAQSTRFLLWGALTMTVLLDTFMLLGAWASTY
jgi:hypothetical protein